MLARDKIIVLTIETQLQDMKTLLLVSLLTFAFSFALSQVVNQLPDKDTQELIVLRLTRFSGADSILCEHMWWHIPLLRGRKIMVYHKTSYDHTIKHTTFCSALRCYIHYLPVGIITHWLFPDGVKE